MKKNHIPRLVEECRWTRSGRVPLLLGLRLLFLLSQNKPEARPPVPVISTSDTRLLSARKVQLVAFGQPFSFYRRGSFVPSRDERNAPASPSRPAPGPPPAARERPPAPSAEVTVPFPEIRKRRRETKGRIDIARDPLCETHWSIYSVEKLGDVGWDNHRILSWACWRSESCSASCWNKGRWHLTYITSFWE